jgi:tetratricopeptide (TPR) repeat protein
MEAVGQYAGFLVLEGRTDTALPYLKRLLSQPGANVEQRIAQIGQLLAQTTDRQATLRVMRELAKDYPKEPRARLEVARAAYNANEDALALSEARTALELRPGWELAALTEAQVLQRRSPAEASAALQAFLQKYPKSADVRLQYARALVAERKYAEARAEFQKLLADFPENTDVVFAVAVLSMQQEDWQLAETNLKRLLNLPFRDKNTVYVYLGQIAEEQKRYPEAIGWYERVTPSEQYLQAQIRRANVAAKQGDVAKGRAMLAEARSRLDDSSNANSQQRVALVLAEAQLLREANRPQEAMEVVGKALDALPNQPDLLYDYAMIAERMDRVELMESTLRKLIQIKPDHAHAYNALGYSLADRDLRLPEAKQLIEKALAIEPDNAMIVDSMGWVLYRMGDLEGSAKYLSKAYEGSRRDPEVAAHYGEVLWKLGRQKEAEAIWKDALNKSPSNETLLKTIQRFQP